MDLRVALEHKVRLVVMVRRVKKVQLAPKGSVANVVILDHRVRKVVTV
jgi:hypothetical protein